VKTVAFFFLNTNFYILINKERGLSFTKAKTTTKKFLSVNQKPMWISKVIVLASGFFFQMGKIPFAPILPAFSLILPACYL
jgi:hypothetical protein